VPSDLRRRLGENHYAFTVMACTGAIREWREKTLLACQWTTFSRREQRAKAKL
jgi:hypothetical protein